MATYRFRDSGLMRGHFNGPLQGCFATMPAITVADDGGGEHKLPAKFPFGQRVLEPELAQQRGQTNTSPQPGLISLPAILQMGLESGSQAGRQECLPVLQTFGLDNQDALIGEVEVLDSQLHTFHESQTGTIKQLGHELMYPVHLREEGLDFCDREDVRRRRRPWVSLCEGALVFALLPLNTGGHCRRGMTDLS